MTPYALCVYTAIFGSRRTAAHPTTPTKIPFTFKCRLDPVRIKVAFYITTPLLFPTLVAMAMTPAELDAMTASMNTNLLTPIITGMQQQMAQMQNTMNEQMKSMQADHTKAMTQMQKSLEDLTINRTAAMDKGLSNMKFLDNMDTLQA